LDRGLGGPRSRSRRGNEEKNVCPCQVFQHTASNFNPLKHEVHSSNIYELISYLKENITPLRYIYLMLFREIIAVYSENYMKPTNMSQNVELLDVQVDDI
jgi:hypothetical protein